MNFLWDFLDFLGWGRIDIFTAVRRENLRELKRILRREPLAVFARGEIGDTALILAVWCGSETCVELLLPLSDATARDSAGRTAVMNAIQFRNDKFVELLLPVSDAKARDVDG